MSMINSVHPRQPVRRKSMPVPKTSPQKLKHPKTRPLMTAQERVKAAAPHLAVQRKTDYYHETGEYPLLKDIMNYPSQDFAAMTCFFNPAKWTSLEDNYKRFVRDFKHWPVPLYVMEVAYGDEPFILDEAQFKVRVRSTDFEVWQKEACFNYIAERIPKQYTKLAWIDADFMFLDRYWFTQASYVLDKVAPVVQLWGNWYHSTAQGQLHEVFPAVGHRGRNYQGLGQLKGHPGGAWAARREIFPIYDKHILGGGDSLMVEAWLGLDDTFCIRSMTPAHRDHWMKWKEKAFAQVNGNIACLPGGGVHLYHGTRANRHYGDRWRILKSIDFSPERQLTVDSESGLLRWRDDVPETVRVQVAQYFRMREEDDQVNLFLPLEWSGVEGNIRIIR